MSYEIKDKDGAKSVSEIKLLFETLVNSTPIFKRTMSLEAVEIGDHLHYTDEETDIMWRGFAIGIRCADRINGTGT